MHRSKTQTALLAAGFGGVLFVLTFLALGAMAPGYDALRETISALEFTALGSAQRINFLVFGLLFVWPPSSDPIAQGLPTASGPATTELFFSFSQSTADGMDQR
jgi:Protein of unknown function (DUF998)